MKESNFLILFVGCALLRLFKILAGRVHIEFSVYLKTVNTPKQRVFSTCWAPFFLAIRRVFLQKMASSGGKSLAVGHISGFQIDPNFPKLLRILPDGFELGIGFGMLLFQSGIRNFRNEKSWIPVAL